MFCDGQKKEIPAKMEIPETQKMGEEIYNYYEDKEYRLFECEVFGRCEPKKVCE